MSVRRSLLMFNTDLLSFLVFLSCLLLTNNTEYLQSVTLSPLTTTTSTNKPRPWKPGLALPLPNSHPPKCTREVPAIFSQYEKDVPIVGNSSVDPHFNVVEVCCRGYKRYDYDWSKCVPDCGDKCQRNSFCLDGGICQCFDEFVLNEDNDCIPTCPLGCPYGQCYLNGTCICNEGYLLDATKRFCIPKCELSCGHNEHCIRPNECECNVGYVRSPPPALMGCQPVCIPDCGYGHCVAPNRCECFLGYQKRQNKSSCESNCYQRCENGFCANHTTCICQNGYQYDTNTTTCLPDCDDDCENGVCIAPGICRCFNGYIREGAKCVAVCERGCGFYGTCIAPNICGCALVDGPLSSFQRCELGYCNFLGRCRCQIGTTRFIDQCLSPDKVTTYAFLHQNNLHATLLAEFNLLIGRHFKLDDDFGKYFY